MIKAISIAALLMTVAAWPSLAQPERDDSGLRAVISELRNCIRSHAEAAYLDGVRLDNQAADFFVRRCDATVSKALAEARVTAVPPGRFRYVAYEESAAFTTHLNGK